MAEPTSGTSPESGPGPTPDSTDSRVVDLLSGPRALLALAILQVAIALLVWEPFPAGIWHDDGVYLLLGRALAEGEGLSYHGVAGAYPAPKFPPVYPSVLAGLWLLLPDVGAVTAAAGILNLAFLVCGCLVFFHLLRAHLDMDPLAAAGLAALAWAPVPVWRSALVPFSEPLFLLLLTVGLLLACRLEGRFSREKTGVSITGTGTGQGKDKGTGTGRGRWPWGRPDGGPIWAGLVFAMLAAIHVRTVGVALVAAVVVVLWAAGRKRTAGFTLGTVGVGMLPWIVWSTRANGRIPESLRDVLGSYGSWLLEQIAAYPEAYLASLHARASDILDRVLTILLPAPSGWEPWVGDFRIGALVLFVPAFLLGLDRIWTRSRAVVLFLFMYLVVIWLWPFQATRLLVPLVPVLLLVVTAGFLWSKAEGGAEGGREEGHDAETNPEGPTEPISPKVVRGWRRVGVAWVVLLSTATAWNLGTGWAGAGYRVNTGALART
ncbi:MAG: hypothetical protein ACOC8K_02895, partial [Gemmatimonadota bacterium]